MVIPALEAIAAAAAMQASKPPPVPPPPPPMRPFPVAPPPPPPPIMTPIGGRPAPIGRNRWFSRDDYPAAALRAEEEGAVRVRLEVGRDGRVTSCTILTSSGSSSLDSATCRIFRSRARFRPARNLRGEAIAGVHLDRVRWQLPDTEPIRLEPATAAIRAELDGPRLVRCSIDPPPAAGAELPALAYEACRIVFDRRMPVPVAFGQGRRSVRIALRLAPAGAEPGEPPPESGQVLFAATASFRVMPSGQVSGCRARVTVRPRARDIPSFDICALLERPALYPFEERLLVANAELTLTVSENDSPDTNVD